MWNNFQVQDYEGMIAETVNLKTADGRIFNAYYSRPLGAGPYPSILLIPHMPGWDEFCRETARRFTQHKYAVICPNIYAKYGKGTPIEVVGRMREEGIRADDNDVMDECESSIDFLRQQVTSNGKVGVIGMCSGGRHTFMAACRLEGIDAAVDCWGGGVMTGDPAPIDEADGLDCPLLGIFGNDDMHPSPAEVDAMEEVLKEKGKDYEFHRYDGAGHGIWYYDKPMYRQQQAMESLEVVGEFFEKHLR